jgi:quercetin dioxygenase-like cupin family protein
LDTRISPVSAFADLAEIARLRIWDGVAARVVGGSGLTLAFVELDPSNVVPEHSHPHEQIGVCVAGSLSFRIGGEERDVGPGGTGEIPGGVPHEVRVGPDGAAVIEAWAPQRDDWGGLETLEQAAPPWPAS